MSKRIITISREFGSGGRSIAKQAAETLGYAYYDKDLVKQVAAETGFDERYVENEGEYAPVTSLFAYALTRPHSQNMGNGLSADDYLWSIQHKIILDLAEKGSCVIVGRCADYILKDRSDCLNVFIHAGMDARAERIVALYGETEKSPRKRLEEMDKKRRIYYKYHTDQEWGMSQNYHLSLDSGALGIDTCVQLIASLAG